MQTNNVYTFQETPKRERKVLGSTIALGLAALVGGIGIDLAINPNAIATITGNTAATATTTGTTKTTSTTGTASTGTVSATGDPIGYQYGTIQLKVTKTNGKITAVDLIQSDATNGREAAFPTLVQAAISSNGSNFGNLGGATFTTDTFKQALDSAISKLG